MKLLKTLVFAAAIAMAPVGATAAEKVLTVAAAAFPDSLLIGRANFAAQSLLAQTNEALVLRDDRGNLSPGLALSWSQIDERTWRFKLRPGVKWHDGAPFSAKDVAFTIQRVIDPQTAYGFLSRLDQVMGAKVVDELTVDISTKSAFPTLLRGLSDILIEPEHFYTAQGAQAMTRKPLGTGPFVFSRWVVGDRYELTSNRSYWGGAPKFDKLVIRQIPEASTRAASLLAGESQIIEEVPVDLLAQLSADRSNKIVETTTSAGLVLSFDTRTPPFDNPKVREAFDLAIDKPTILREVLMNHGELLQGQLLTASTFGFNPKIKPRPYNPEKAKALLKEAGFDFSTPVPITYQAGKYLSDVDIVNVTIGMLGKIGVKAVANLMESGTYTKAATANKLGPMNLIAWYSLGDANFAATWYTQSSKRALWQDKGYEELFEAAKSELDENKRRAIYQQMMEIMHVQNPSVFLFGLQSIYGVKTRVRGFGAPADKVLRLGKVVLD